MKKSDKWALELFRRHLIPDFRGCRCPKIGQLSAEEEADCRGIPGTNFIFRPLVLD